MNRQDKYREITLKVHDPANAGALIDILQTHKTNDGVLASLGTLQVSGASGSIRHGDSKSVTIVVPGLRTGTAQNGCLFTCSHADLPSGIDIEFGYENVYSADVLAAANTDVTGTLTPRTRLANMNPYQALEIDHDAVAGEIGIVKMQPKKTIIGTVAPYQYQSDRGNAGRVIISAYLPYTEGNVSGLATETVEEGAGTGQTHLLIRRAGSDTPYWQIGCHQNTITESFQYEYAQIMKGYKDTILTDSIRKQLENFEMILTGKSENLMRFLKAGIIQDTRYGKEVKASFDGELEKYEMILRTTTPSGLLHFVRLPVARIKPNGNIEHGSESPTIPVLIEGGEVASDLFWSHLYQVVHFSMGIEVIA